MQKLPTTTWLRKATRREEVSRITRIVTQSSYSLTIKDVKYMDLNKAVEVLATTLKKRRPQQCNGTWISVHAPKVYKIRPEEYSFGAK